jgi:thiamine biosynthesis protein ThiI
MRRGCRVMAVHFHSYPILSRASQEKVRELAALLTRYQQYTKVYMVPFGEIQQQVVLAVAPPLRVVIYRRLMVRIAEALAEKCGAKALVTGEVIGQVASQTLENMTSIGSVATLPIFRPLIGMDKEEITAEAQKLGTYPISIIEDQDCCQLFTPKHPATKARPRDIEIAELNLPIDEFVQSAVREAAVEEFKFPMIECRAERGI